MGKTQQRKHVAHDLIQNFRLSERRTCYLAEISRTVLRYKPTAGTDTTLCAHLKMLVMEYPRYGYLLLHGLLRQEGLVQNKN